jgi:hypothetical protein
MKWRSSELEHILFKSKGVYSAATKTQSEVISCRAFNHYFFLPSTALSPIGRLPMRIRYRNTLLMSIHDGSLVTLSGGIGEQLVEIQPTSGGGVTADEAALMKAEFKEHWQHFKLPGLPKKDMKPPAFQSSGGGMQVCNYLRMVNVAGHICQCCRYSRLCSFYHIMFPLTHTVVM